MVKCIFHRNIIVLLFSFLCANRSFSQELISFPFSLLQPLPGYTVPVDVYVIDGTLPGSGNYTWSVSPSTGVSGLLASTALDSQRVVFSSSAIDQYVFTISRGGVSIKDTVTVCNLLFSMDGSPYGWGQLIGGFSVNQGAVSSNAPNEHIFFSNRISYRAPGIGVNKQGYIYYIPNIDNEGDFYVLAASPNGDTVKIATNFDINGSDPTPVLFPRLGIDASGVGWVLAADTNYSKLYLAKFNTNGTGAISPTVVSSNVTFANANGSIADFGNGDLAIDGDGIMMVLANNGEGNTVIYSLDTKVANPVLTKRFQVNDNNNQPFSSSVNGVAFDSLGNVYFCSLGNGLYYVPKSTLNTSTGTVTASLVYPLLGLIDLATNYWPKTSIVPLKFGNFTAEQKNNNVLLNWTTYSEENVNYFEIERSYTGSDFKKIGIKKAVGNSALLSTYNFTDTLNTNTSYIYYRLKTVDVDGNFSYSPIVKIKVPDIVIKNIQVYPNPFTNKLKLQIFGTKKTTGTLIVVNTLGQYVINSKINIEVGNNTIDLSSKTKKLKAGSYSILIISEDGSVLQERILKK